MKANNLLGKKFGRILVISEPISTNGRSYFICQCDCGNICKKNGKYLSNGDTRSCGCLQKEFRPPLRITHGMTGKPGYQTLYVLKDRCYNQNNKSYKLYGERGIKVCERWLGSDGAVNFHKDMGVRPSKSHSIDRIDTNGDYEPNNCRWATIGEQNRNKRNNRWIEYNGDRKILADWAIFFNIAPCNLRVLLKAHDMQYIHKNISKYKKLKSLP